MCSVALTNISKDGGHCVSPSLVAGQAAVHSSILFLHVSYNQSAVRSHPVSEHKQDSQFIIFISAWSKMEERRSSKNKNLLM